MSWIVYDDSNNPIRVFHDLDEAWQWAEEQTEEYCEDGCYYVEEG